jgi:hypothetical protein
VTGVQTCALPILSWRPNQLILRQPGFFAMDYLLACTKPNTRFMKFPSLSK